MKMRFKLSSSKWLPFYPGVKLISKVESMREDVTQQLISLTDTLLSHKQKMGPGQGIWPLQWRHNERDGVSNHRRLDG